MMQYKGWEGFVPGKWMEEVNVRDFIQRNYTPYFGDESFLAGPTEATTKLWDEVLDLLKQERANGGVLDADTDVIGTITSHGPGYIDKDLEKIVGLQTDKPLKRALQPFGGIKMSVQACEMYGYQVTDRVKEIFTKYRKTHNDGAESQSAIIRVSCHVENLSFTRNNHHTAISGDLTIFCITRYKSFPHSAKQEQLKILF